MNSSHSQSQQLGRFPLIPIVGFYISVCDSSDSDLMCCCGSLSLSLPTPPPQSLIIRGKRETVRNATERSSSSSSISNEMQPSSSFLSIRHRHNKHRDHDHEPMPSTSVRPFVHQVKYISTASSVAFCCTLLQFLYRARSLSLVLH